MKKLDLSKTERKAVENSINHWKKDIQKHFLDGDEIIVVEDGYSVKLVWEKTGKKVKDTSKHCSLCKKAISLGCSVCPYYKYYGFKCEDYEYGHWKKWRFQPNLKNCDNMIKALERILK